MTGGGLGNLLAGQDNNVDPSLLLQSPFVRLQLRKGAEGGNLNRIDMTGQTSIYVRRVSAGPLVVDNAPDMREQGVGYFQGGRIPAGKCFVITSIRYRGYAAGDSNGHGAFLIHAGIKVVENVRQKPVIAEKLWTGEIIVRPGEENSVYLEVANSSGGEAAFNGELRDEPR